MDASTSDDRREHIDDGHNSIQFRIAEDILNTTGKSIKNTERNYLRNYVYRCYDESQKSNGVFLQDVILCRTEDGVKDVVTAITSNMDSYTRSVLFISSHDTHIHIIHDCSYAGGSCRCYWRKKISEKETVEFRKRLVRQRRRNIRELSVSDWMRLILYLCTEGRRKESAYFNGEVQNIPDAIKSLASERLERPRRQGSEMAREDPSCLERNPDDIRELFENGESDRNDGRCNPKTSEGRKRKREEDQTIFQQLRRILFEYPMSPIVNILQHDVYLTSPIGFLRARNCKVQDTFDHIQSTMISWSIKDYYTNIYSKKNCFPIFCAGYTKVDDYYYDLDSSVEILNSFLKFQFHDNDEDIYNFLFNLYNILERKLPKRNCLLVCSPPSAGKNFFFDCILDYFLNKGQLGRANKTNNFAFQEAHNKRIILWNEPSYEAAAIETIKMITGGDAYTVNVKNRPDAAVYKTPIIILTNNPISIMNSPVFRDRIAEYAWQPAPYLKEYKKKPYPLATYHLFKLHGFIKDD